MESKNLEELQDKIFKVMESRYTEGIKMGLPHDIAYKVASYEMQKHLKGEDVTMEEITAYKNKLLRGIINS